jgi:hypothetical protein
MGKWQNVPICRWEEETMKKTTAEVTGAKTCSPFTPEISKKLDEREAALRNGGGVKIADLNELSAKIGSLRPGSKRS